MQNHRGPSLRSSSTAMLPVVDGPKTAMRKPVKASYDDINKEKKNVHFG